MAILAGDVGQNIVFLAVLMATAVGIVIVAFVAIFWSTKHSEATDSHALAKHEKKWVVIIAVILIAFTLSNAAYLPYPYAHSNTKPTMIADVQAQQFTWCISPAPMWGSPNCETNFPIPVGSTVLFNVTSIDVNHGFGVYSPGGELLFQVQVMPGFYNSIMYQFTKPGIYYVRCLEFCGYGHYAMTNQMNVT